jgi:phosphatidate cytidylyltransferase
MRKRILAILGLALVGMPAVILGGVFYFLLMGVFLVGATWEYVQLFRAMKMEPQIHVAVGGVALICATRMFFPHYALPVFEAIILIAMAAHLVAYERGRDQAALDFTITVAGLVYIGWIGAYLFDLRNLPNGGWWMMLVMPSVWFADSGAYFLGKTYGKHPMTPRLSPKKSWEGYAASVFTGALGGAFLAYAYSAYGNLAGAVTILQGATLGLLMGALPTLGDLGESMIKRQSGIKDSGDAIPGHGGFFDRVDSWPWGALIGYYFLVWFIL